jgi:hypothetical protein
MARSTDSTYVRSATALSAARLFMVVASRSRCSFLRSSRATNPLNDSCMVTIASSSDGSKRHTWIAFTPVVRPVQLSV